MIGHWPCKVLLHKVTAFCASTHPNVASFNMNALYCCTTFRLEAVADGYFAKTFPLLCSLHFGVCVETGGSVASRCTH